MPFQKFCAYTLAGSLPWCCFLTYIGFKLGQHWDTVGKYFHQADRVVGAIFLIMAVLWVRRHLHESRADSAV